MSDERFEDRDPEDGFSVDDALAELRGAWRAASAPDPERGADDEESEAVAAWLHSAWDALEAPAASDEAIRRLVVRTARPRQAERRLTPRPAWPAWIGLAAAAALALWVVLDRVPRDSSGAVVDVAAVPPTTNMAQPREPDGLAPIEVTEVTPERMELRSGPVRLVLLNEWTDEASETETR